MKKPSDVIKYDVETLPHRALLVSAGVKPEDLASDKPFIGIANSYNDLVPGHIHLNELTAEVKRGVIDAGGIPFVWGVPGVCDGIAMHVEMRLSLPSREHIADNIEIMAYSHSLDGWVGVTNCDKITPGMLIAAGRMNLPAIILTGGPMKANTSSEDGKKHHPIEGFGIVGKVKGGIMKPEDAKKMLKCLSCGAGSCVGLFTANTMAVVTESIGMSLTGCATALAVSELKRKQAYETGKRIVELVKQNVRPRDIMNATSFENAIRVDMAMGGSTNTVLHIPAIAKAAGVDINVMDFDRISRETPNLCKIIPAGPYEMADIHESGGIPAVLKQLLPLLKDNPTVNGKSILEIAKAGTVKNSEIIRPMDNPYMKEGGIAVLKGNICNSSVIKQTAVDPSMMVHTGPAKVYLTESDLLDAVEKKEIQEGDVLILPFQGPCGAPGMPEMLTPTDAIMGAGYKRVAIITDGRFSGGTSGPCIGHVEMEAYNGGAIGAIRNGDIVEIDIPNRKLNVKLSDEEIKKRLSEVKPPARKTTPLMDTFRQTFTGKNCYGQ